jgi:cytochrome c oxidase cbb3-type subunit 3
MKNKFIYTWGLALLLLVVSNLTLLAQAENTAGDPYLVERIMGNLILLLGIVAIIGGFWGVMRMSSMVLEAQKIQLIKEHGLEVAEKVGWIQKESFWQRQYKRWTKNVPLEKEEDILMHHNYDGIQELDNSLPPWWVAMFYITILFGGIYMVYYHFAGIGLNSAEQYEYEIEIATKAKQAYLAKQANTVDETNAVMIEDEAELAIGEASFKSKCAACHGQLGEGGVGPNLTDQYWLHGGDIKDVFRVIKYGVPEKGMIAWQNQMNPSEMIKVASYIKTLEGTNPPNAKEPQGELYQPEQADRMPSDSTAATPMIGMK